MITIFTKAWEENNKKLLEKYLEAVKREYLEYDYDSLFE